MMMASVIMVVMVAVGGVSAAFGLKGSLHDDQVRSEAMEHMLDDMVRPNEKKLVSNFRRQMAISQIPSETRKLVGVFMPNFDDKLCSGLNFHPVPIFKQQAISLSHRNRLRKVEKDVFALIRNQANAAPMPCVKIESESACGLFLWPKPCRAMNRSAVHRHIST
jgi:hypothetical protein